MSDEIDLRKQRKVETQVTTDPAVIQLLTDILAAVDGLELSVGNIELDADAINLNTDGIEAKLEDIKTKLDAITTIVQGASTEETLQALLDEVTEANSSKIIQILINSLIKQQIQTNKLLTLILT